MSVTATPADAATTTPAPAATPDAAATPAQPATPAPPATVRIGNRDVPLADVEAAIKTSSDFAVQMREIAQQKAAAEALAAKLKDPKQLRAAIKEAGHNEIDFAAELLLEEQAREQKDPKELEYEQLKAEKAAREEADAAAKKQAEEQKFRVAAEQLMQRNESAIVDAMGAHKLPMTPKVAEALVVIMEDALAAGWDITPAEAATTYRAQHVEANKGFYEAMDADQLYENLSPATIKKIVDRHEKGLRDAAKAADPERVPSSGKPRKPAPSDDDLKDLSGHDWVDAMLRRR